MIANAIIKAMQVMTITVIVVECDVFSVEPALIIMNNDSIYEGGIISLLAIQGQNYIIIGHNVQVVL